MFEDISSGEGTTPNPAEGSQPSQTPGPEVTPQAAAPGEGPAPEQPPSVEQPPKPKRSCGRGCGIVALALISAVVGGLVGASIVPWALGIPPWKLFDQPYLTKKLGNGERFQVIRKITSGDETEAVVAVAAKVSPSVVYISTTQRQPDVFGGEQTVEGQGSGVIYRSDGYIITNNHVVAGADKIYVTIENEAPIAGKVVGRDAESDLALVKVDKSGLPAAELGSSKDLVVGQLTVAVGSPFGLAKSVTSGVISALHRNTVAQTESGETVTYGNLIQTDAAINPGNSGGALANGQGQVIGVNTLIRSPSGASAGIGFAIPIDFVKSVTGQLLAGKSVGHAYIGVYPAPVTPTGAHAVPGVTEGALVARLVPNGPAAKAGIQKSDVIVQIGAIRIKGVEDLFAAVRQQQPGAKVDVTFYRGKSRRTVAVTLAARPKQPSVKAGPNR